MMRTRSPRWVVTTYRMRSRGDIASVKVFSGCAMSSKSTENGSRMASAASSKETLCFLRFANAFSASHSKSPKTTVATSTKVRPFVERVEQARGVGGYSSPTRDRCGCRLGLGYFLFGSSRALPDAVRTALSHSSPRTQTSDIDDHGSEPVEAACVRHGELLHDLWKARLEGLVPALPTRALILTSRRGRTRAIRRAPTIDEVTASLADLARRRRRSHHGSGRNEQPEHNAPSLALS